MQTLAKSILTTVNRKVPYQKYLAFTKTMNCSKCHMTKAARKGLAETSSQKSPKWPNRSKIDTLTRFRPVPPKGPYLEVANRRVVRFKGKMVKNEVISRSLHEVQSGQMTKIWGFGHGFERLWELVQGLAATSLQDPQRGPKWSKSGQI